MRIINLKKNVKKSSFPHGRISVLGWDFLLHSSSCFSSLCSFFLEQWQAEDIIQISMASFSHLNITHIRIIFSRVEYICRIIFFIHAHTYQTTRNNIQYIGATDQKYIFSMILLILKSLPKILYKKAK